MRIYGRYWRLQFSLACSILLFLWHSAASAGDPACPNQCLCIPAQLAPKEPGPAERRASAARAVAGLGEADKLILLEDPALVGEVRRRLRTEGRGALVAVRRSLDVSVALTQLDRPMGELSVIYTIPTDAATFAKVHGKKPSPRELAKLRAMKARMEKRAGPALKLMDLERRAASDSAREVLLQTLGDRPAGAASLVVGHSVAGRLILGDGTFVLLSELAEEARRGPLILLTCNGLSSLRTVHGFVYAANRRIRYSEATGAIAQFASAFRRNESLGAILRRLESGGALKFGIGLAGALIMLQIVDDGDGRSDRSGSRRRRRGGGGAE